jgi:ligand-binding SRPBCC domain-containing protein
MVREYALERTQVVPAGPPQVFDYFSDPLNLERITPNWLRFRIVEAPERLERGSVLVYRLRLFGLAIQWRTLITDWRPPRSFSDTQVSGPYPLWEHTHRLSPFDGGTEIYDHVRYRVPGGPLAPIVHRIVGRWLDGIFDYRRARVEEIFSGGTSTSKDVLGA